MGKASVLPKRPAMWAIEAGASGPGSEIARLGQRRFKVADVERLELEEIRDRNEQGVLMGAIAFVCFATALAYLVFDAGWRARFLLGSWHTPFGAESPPCLPHRSASSCGHLDRIWSVDE